MATLVDLPLMNTKNALKVAYDQAARAEKAAEDKYGSESPMAKGLGELRMKLNNAILTAKESK